MSETMRIRAEEIACTRRLAPSSRSQWVRESHEGIPEPTIQPGARARAAMRLRHFSRRTEEAYVAWMLRFWKFSGHRNPADLGPAEVTAFLSSLATRGKVAAATQNQALAALLFLFREVLGRQLPWLDGLVRAKVPTRLPVVMSRDEVRAVLTQMRGTPRLMETLLYGAGLRLLECCRLRVKDVDFQRHQLVIRQGKGDKDRVTMLPSIARSALIDWLERVHAQHTQDLAAGAGWVELPHALLRKFPSAGREWPWQWVFPATRTYVESDSGQRRRHSSSPPCRRRPTSFECP
ncbi:MAG: integron integrase [Planctomycetota bacterium]